MLSNRSAMPAAGFQSVAVAPEERFRAWLDYMSPVHEIRPLQQPPLASPTVSSRGWDVDGLLVTDLAFTPIKFRRRPDAGRILVRLYQSGHSRGVLGREAYSTAPGEIHVFDQTLACDGDSRGAQTMKSIYVPYQAVGYRPGQHRGHIRVCPQTATGRILGQSIELLLAALPDADATEAPVLASGFCGLVQGLLLRAGPAANDSADFHATRRQAMRRYLEEHLADPELGVEKLCAVFFVSRATVYRDFAEEGGVARFVTRRRLERAYQELAAGAPERGRVHRVAERWGFTSQYHFSRLFRQQFDVAPSDICASVPLTVSRRYR